MEEKLVPSVFDQMTNEKPTFEYATKGQRFINCAIDLVGYFLYNYLVYIVIGMIMILAGKSEEDIAAIITNPLYGAPFTLFNYFSIYLLTEGITKGNTLVLLYQVS